LVQRDVRRAPNARSPPSTFSETTMTPASRLVPIGEVARPHGVGGELRVKVYNEETTLFARGRTVVLRQAGKEDRRCKIGAVRSSNAALLLRLDGVSGRDDAEAVRGAQILVPRSDFPAPAEGEFYAVDIEGARAELAGETVGTVRRLLTYPACSALEVELADGRVIEVPLVDQYVDEVDAEAYVVRLRSIEDL
jgi:16S rRNA processing protein RimM